MNTPLRSPETFLERHHFRLLCLSFVGLAIASLVFAVIEEGWGSLGRISAVAASAQVLGKWVIFAGVKANNPYGFGPWTISYIIFVLDLLIALLLNTFLPQLERIPYLGPWLVRTRLRASSAYSEYPKLRKMAWTGVTLWVFLPLPASGAVTGSFASRLVGLSRTMAIAAIATGSALNGAIFAALAAWLGAEGEALRTNWKLTAACALLLLVVLWLGWRRLVKMLREDG